MGAKGRAALLYPISERINPTDTVACRWMQHQIREAPLARQYAAPQRVFRNLTEGA